MNYSDKIIWAKFKNGHLRLLILRNKRIKMKTIVDMKMKKHQLKIKILRIFLTNKKHEIKKRIIL